MGFWWNLFNAPIDDDEQWKDFMGEVEVTPE
jgi:hypothetical protein